MKNYVQIGTNNGNDDFMEIIKKLNTRSRIILIEPLSKLIDIIKECYSSLAEKHDINILNIGIVSNKKINTLYEYDGSFDFALSSVIKRNSFDCISSSITFEPFTLQEVCDTFEINKIELLYIDTEGYDYEILNSLDLNKLDIYEIICEKWNYDIDSSDSIKTGPMYFNNVILEKYKKYEISDYDTRNHRFIKK